MTILPYDIYMKYFKHHIKTKEPELMMEMRNTDDLTWLHYWRDDWKPVDAATDVISLWGKR